MDHGRRRPRRARRSDSSNVSIALAVFATRLLNALASLGVMSPRANDGKLIYAGRVGTGMPDKVLADLRRRLELLARAKPPLSVLPPRKTRFGSPLVPRALGRAEACRRDHLLDLDGR
jgi:ATP dependent DNA ligase C terminal region